MTIIVAVSDGDRVVMGGDSSSVSGYDVMPTALTKVFKVLDMAVGYTSSFRMGQILQHHLARNIMQYQDTAHGELDTYMVTHFVEICRILFKDMGYSRIENNEENGGTFLVGIRGRIYRIDSDFQVNRSRLPYDAVGAGQSYAFGSLYSTEGLKPRQRVEKALKAAVNFSGACIPPFTILTA